MSMKLSDSIAQAINDAVKSFGTYAYNDKGPSEVMDLNAILADIRKMPSADVLAELKTVCRMPNMRVDPSYVVEALLVKAQEEPALDYLYEDTELLDLGRF